MQVTEKWDLNNYDAVYTAGEPESQDGIPVSVYVVTNRTHSLTVKKSMEGFQ